MTKLFDAGPGAWGSGKEKPKVITCPSCGKLVYADKAKMDEHFESKHEKNVYTPVQPGSPERPRVLGLKWYQEIRGMLIDYPKGIMAWTGIVLIATLLLSLLRFSR